MAELRDDGMMGDKQYTLTRSEMRQAWVDTMDNRGGTFSEFMAKLSEPPSLRDGCPVAFDLDQGIGFELFCCVSKRATNIRALITTSEAREIAYWALFQMSKRRESLSYLMAEVDRKLHAYKYGE